MMTITTRYALCLITIMTMGTLSLCTPSAQFDLDYWKQRNEEAKQNLNIANNAAQVTSMKKAKASSSTKTMWYDDSNESPPRSNNADINDALFNLESLFEYAVEEEEEEEFETMKTSIDTMHKQIYEDYNNDPSPIDGAPSPTTPSAAEIAKSTNAVVQATFASWDKLTSRDTTQIIIGSTEILSAFGGAIPGFGPFIQLGASLVGGFFGLKGSKSSPSIASIIQDIIDDALASYKDEEQRALLMEISATLSNDNDFLEVTLKNPIDPSNTAEYNALVSYIGNLDGFNAGRAEMENLLAGIIGTGSGPAPYLTTDNVEAERVANLIRGYCHIHMLREHQVYLLQTLWTSLGATTLGQNLVTTMQNDIDDTMRPKWSWINLEGWDSGRTVTSMLHESLLITDLDLVENFLDNIVHQPIAGTFVKVRSKNQNEYMSVEGSYWDKHLWQVKPGERPMLGGHHYVTTSPQDNIASTMFRIVGNPGNFRMFSIATRKWIQQGAGSYDTRNDADRDNVRGRLNTARCENNHDCCSQLCVRPINGGASCRSGDNLWDEGSFLMAFSNIRNSNEYHPRGAFSYDSETGYIQGISGSGIVSKSNRMYLNNKYNRVSWAIDENIKSTENDEWEFIDRNENNIKTFSDNRVSVDSFSYMGNDNYEVAFPTSVSHPCHEDVYCTPSQYDFCTINFPKDKSDVTAHDCSTIAKKSEQF